MGTAIQIRVLRLYRLRYMVLKGLLQEHSDDILAIR
jgi:hypothetical protein